MWMPRRPRESQVIDFLLQADAQPLNYASVGDLDSLGGATRFSRSIHLGTGVRLHADAMEVLTNWLMFPKSRIDLYWPDRGTRCGTSLAIGMHLYGNYWLNPCRVTEFMQTPIHGRGDAVTRITWRTIKGHCLVGSESFSLRMKPTGEVRYEIDSIAAPVQLLRPFRKLIDYARRNFQAETCQQFAVALNDLNHHTHCKSVHSSVHDMQPA